MLFLRQIYCWRGTTAGTGDHWSLQSHCLIRARSGGPGPISCFSSGECIADRKILLDSLNCHLDLHAFGWSMTVDRALVQTYVRWLADAVTTPRLCTCFHFGDIQPALEREYICSCFGTQAEAAQGGSQPPLLPFFVSCQPIDFYCVCNKAQVMIWWTPLKVNKNRVSENSTPFLKRFWRWLHAQWSTSWGSSSLSEWSEYGRAEMTKVLLSMKYQAGASCSVLAMLQLFECGPTERPRRFWSQYRRSAAVECRWLWCGWQ